MLQYPVQLPPLSLSSSPKSAKDYQPRADYFRSNDLPNSSRISPSALTANKRFLQKESFVPRSPFAGLHSPSTTPLSVSTNFASSSPTSSPPIASAKLPRSPYISARPLSSHSPVPVPPVANQHSSWAAKSPAESRVSSLASCSVEDVLAPGDCVGQDVILQGESIRLVSIGSSPRPENSRDYKEPAKEFEVVRRLGAGSYAVVYLVVEVLYRPPPSEDGHMSMMGAMEMDGKYLSRPGTVYGREYAIKCLSKANLDTEDLAAQMSEVTIHQSLRSHPNIVTLHRTLETSSFLLLLLEYVPGEDLFYFLEQARDHYDSDTTNPADSISSSRTPPTPSLLSNMHPSQLLSRTRLRLISSMFSQMCDAVAACHAQQVFHRDIKPENFIVTDGWITMPDGRQERKVIVKLTDFGLSTSDLESSDMDCGSAPYMSYECRNNVAPTYRPRAADVWSLGIVLINMLYHYNPWTDTAQGACSSFDLYRSDPIKFFMCRFTGMTQSVAETLANRIFCILDNSDDDSQRMTAADFGAWAKDLPALFAVAGPAHQRTVSNAASQGHPIACNTPISHRPTSRHPSGISTAIRTPAMQTRSLSRAPSLGPAADEREEKSELSTVFDQELEELDELLDEQDDRDAQDIEIEGMTSRSTSTNKRRKRGLRKGKGAVVPIPTSPTTPKDETLATLAVASQSLAWEISKSKSSSHRSVSTNKTSTTTSSRRARKPFEPVSMYAMPTPLLTNTSSARTRSASAKSPASTISPTPAPSSVSTSTSTTTPAPATAPVPTPITKKPSKWKLSFGRNTAASMAAGGPVSPVEEVSPPTSLDLGGGSGSSGGPPSMSATAINVTNLIMGLSAPSAHSAHSSQASRSDDGSSTWSRGRRARATLAPPAPPVPSGGAGASRGHPASTSTSPPLDSWMYAAERRSDRAVSPNSTRSGRPVASSASSMVSGNWRNSMSTTSSAGTSTSAFTRYSNSSTRSISTTATSVSSTSWRTSSKPPSMAPSTTSSTNKANYTTLPKNVKLMNGVPWELDQLPRGQHPNPVGDIFGAPPARKQRTRKPKDLKLDTITERPPTQKSPLYQRRDVSTSTTDLSGVAKEDGDGSKKVQKGQINALAKMLSALRR